MEPRYCIKIKHYAKGAYGKTRHKFSTRTKSIMFAAGYQAALRDCGRSDLYVVVYDGSECVCNSDSLAEIGGKQF